MKYLKHFNENIQSEKFYHASNKLFDTLKILITNDGEDKFLGEGIYITNSEPAANTYGEHIYEVTILEPLKSLQYIEDIPRKDLMNIVDILTDSDIDDLNYIADNLQDLLDEDKSLWGKSLISEFKRYDVDVNSTVIKLGYNSIEAPLNKMNQFLKYPNTDRNICIIKNDILKIKLIK
jgi:hypothetical protein